MVISCNIITPCFAKTSRWDSPFSQAPQKRPPRCWWNLAPGSENEFSTSCPGENFYYTLSPITIISTVIVVLIIIIIIMFIIITINHHYRYYHYCSYYYYDDLFIAIVIAIVIVLIASTTVEVSPLLFWFCLTCFRPLPSSVHAPWIFASGTVSNYIVDVEVE